MKSIKFVVLYQLYNDLMYQVNFILRFVADCTRALTPTSFVASTEWAFNKQQGSCGNQPFHLRANEASMSQPLSSGIEGWCYTESLSTSSGSVNDWRPFLQVDLGQDFIVSRVSAQRVTVNWKWNCVSDCTNKCKDPPECQDIQTNCNHNYHSTETSHYCVKQFYLAYLSSSQHSSGQTFQVYKLRGQPVVGR